MNTDKNDGERPGHELVHRELSEAIIGAAMKVSNTLKPGLDEKLYDRALAIELRKRGYHVDTKKQFPVSYEVNWSEHSFPT
jgi:GxxExxY protein